MSKTYKGYELIKAIADGEIKDGSRFIEKSTMREYIYANEEIYMNRAYYEEEALEYLADGFSMKELSLAEFELIEDEIYIDNIEELYINDIKSIGESEIKCWTGRNLDIALGNKINELVQAVKQLNKEVKELSKRS